MFLFALILIPFCFGLLAIVMRTPTRCLAVMVTGVFLSTILGVVFIIRFFCIADPIIENGWLFIDALSAYHLAVLFLVFCMTALFALVYFKTELKNNGFSLYQARLFSCLFTESLASMTLTLLSNNLGVMWVGIEATTLITAFLIYLHPTRESLEAMWKYIIICSVGVAFAFMGTLLIAASAQGLNIPVNETMLFTTLRTHAKELNPALIKTAFIFILVGYGTKAGLAPLHNWLPDAHSQAPAPVSAMFSGFMLNAALYCIMRFIPITGIALDDTGWASGLLIVFGLLSISVAAAFIIFQTNLKRLLAFCSVEHMGIIILGLGFGGLGVFAALFHTLTHSVSKTLSFFSAGRLGQIFGTHDMRKMGGAFHIKAIWAIGLFGSMLALIGAAPFCTFTSEFLVAKAAVEKGAYPQLVIFLLGIGIIFVGMLGRAIPLFWDKPERSDYNSTTGKLEYGLVILPLILLILLGLFMPLFLKDILIKASAVINISGPVSPFLLKGAAQ